MHSNPCGRMDSLTECTAGLAFCKQMLCPRIRTDFAHGTRLRKHSTQLKERFEIWMISCSGFVTYRRHNCLIIAEFVGEPIRDLIEK